MPETIRTVFDAVYNNLSTNPTLISPTIKAFYRGNIDRAKPIFPFLCVGNIRYENESLTIGPAGAGGGRDRRTYTLSLVVGTKNLVSTNAFNEVLDLLEKVHLAVRVNRFGVFAAPVEIVSIESEPQNEEGTIWLGRVDISGYLYITRQNS